VVLLEDSCLRRWARYREEVCWSGGLHFRVLDLGLIEVEERRDQLLLVRVGGLRSWARIYLFEGWSVRLA
jgi:hypothetical protein